MVSLNSYNLMQQYIKLIYIKDCFYKVGDLECSGACLAQRNYVYGPHTRAGPLLAPLPLAHLVPRFPVCRSWPAPLVLLLALPPAILYDAIV
jgi:hypothetical protein